MAMTGRTLVSIVLSLLGLSASFVAAILITIFVTREMEALDLESDVSEV
jgi:hypothetical protein